MRRLKQKIIFALALAMATPAAAHVPPIELAENIDLRHETTAQELVQPFPVFAGTTAFEDLARIELPPPSLAGELAHRFAAGDVRSRSDLAIFDRTVSRKLASGPLAAFEENNINELNELGPELRRAMGFQALPFSEPATGLVFARERWYDPGTGSFLSPDPMGYRDSPNLYAFAGGDPVNGRDPTGEGKIWDWVKGEVEEKAGNAVAVLEAGVGCSKALLRPDLIATEKITDAYGRVKRVAQAYERGGVSWATDQYVIEEKAFLKTVPFVRTYFAAKEVPDAAKKGRFQKGLQTGRTAISAASDLALLYAAASGFRAVTTTSSAIVVETEANAIPATTPLNGGATPLNVGEVMSYREYLSRRTSGSNLRGHHIPQSARLQELGLEPLDGTVVVMENRLTGGAGEKLGHTGTRTYGVGGSRAAAAERGQPLTVSEGRDLLDPPVMRLGDEVAQMIRDLNRKIYPDHY